MRISHVILFGGLIVLAGCGKKDSQKTTGDANGKDSTAAVSGSTEGEINVSNAPFGAVVTGRGFKVVQAREFPAQLTSRRGAVVVYQSADATNGGIVYTMSMPGQPDKVVWHWRFTDQAPDSIAALELNGDGLWDVRVYMRGGKTVDMEQDRDFCFRGPERDALAAMNGPASAPELWKAFDGDTATAWSSPAANAYIEMANPFGLTAGELAVRLAGGNRPGKLTLTGGSASQSLDLEPTAEEQRFTLDAGFKEAPTIRVEFDAKGANVALSELGIR